MRQEGTVKQAVLQAVRDWVESGHGPGAGATLAEIAQHARVGKASARSCVQNLRASGELEIVGQREVHYRNRPVAEYAPADVVASRAVVQGGYQGWVELGRVFSSWSRQE